MLQGLAITQTKSEVRKGTAESIMMAPGKLICDIENNPDLDKKNLAIRWLILSGEIKERINRYNDFEIVGVFRRSDESVSYEIFDTLDDFYQKIETNIRYQKALLAVKYI